MLQADPEGNINYCAFYLANPPLKTFSVDRHEFPGLLSHNYHITHTDAFYQTFLHTCFIQNTPTNFSKLELKKCPTPLNNSAFGASPLSHNFHVHTSIINHFYDSHNQLIWKINYQQISQLHGQTWAKSISGLLEIMKALHLNNVQK